MKRPKKQMNKIDIYSYHTIDEKTNSRRRESLITLKKCILTALMILCCASILFAQDGTTEAVRPTNWADQNAGTEENPYLIANLANLRWLSENSNDWWQNINTPIHFRQTVNIDATETSLWNSNQGFQPIGRASESNRFIGVYDGGNFSISNIYIRRNNANIGFFHTIINSTIKNLNLTNVDMSGNDSTNVGVLAYTATNSTIQNCSTTGTLFNVRQAGGIINLLTSTTPNQTFVIQDSFSSVSITSSVSSGVNHAGGIISSFSLDYENHNFVIQNSYATGNISVTYGTEFSSQQVAVGGIIGHLPIGVSNNSYEINNCYATGNVTATATSEYASIMVGGIIGYVVHSSGQANTSFNVINCYSTGEISGLRVGGIIGHMFNLSNQSNVSFNIQNCYSSGIVSGNNLSRSFVVGGIVGHAQSTNLARISIQSSYSSADLIGSTNNSRVGGIVGISTYTNIQNSFSSGNISVSGADSFGSGIVGLAEQYTDIINSYSTANTSGSMVSGLVGNLQSNNSVSNSFWDIEATGTPRGIWYLSGTSTNNHGLSTIEMKQASTYIESDWDFSEVWAIMEGVNDGYPFLRAITDVPPSPPGSPTNLIGTMENNSILLYWELPDVRSLVSFTVYRNGVEIEDGITSTFYIDETVVNNTQYTYTVAAVYTTHTSDPSHPFVIWTRYPVRNLTNTFDERDVVLNWQAPLGGTVNGYRIYKEGEAITTNPITALTFTDIAAEPGVTYTYQVRAVYTSGMSQPVGVTLTTPLYNPPTALVAEVIGMTIRLDWVAPDVSAEFAILDGYKVYRNTEAITDIIENEFFVDTSAVPGFMYGYHVTAVYSEPYGESVPSNTVHEGVEAPEVMPPGGLSASIGDERVVLTWQLPGSSRGAGVFGDNRWGWEYDAEEDVWYADGDFNSVGSIGTIDSTERISAFPAFSERTSAFPTDGRQSRQQLSHFKVFRNDVLVAENVRQTRYVDTTVSNQTAYTYHITAVYVNPDVESDPSEGVEITTRFPVRGLTASLFGYDVRLNWIAPVGGGASSYNIYKNEILV